MEWEDETPHYVHDCDKCVFLGTWRGQQNVQDRLLRNYDLYVCGDNVVARFGDDGPEYHSGMAFVGIINPLTEAKKRAEIMGIDFDLIKRQKRDETLQKAFRTFSNHWDVLRVYQWFADMQARLWMVDDDFYADLATVMREGDFNKAQIKAAVDFVQACKLSDEDFLNGTQSQD